MDNVKVRTTLPLVVPDVHDFMKWHVYVGYNNENKAEAAQLYELLDKRGFVCTLRNSLDVKEESTLQNIREGVTFSHKCLLFVTREYVNDEDSKDELNEAERKVEILGKNSVVALVESSVPEERLEKLNQFSMIRLKPNQTVFSKDFIDEKLVGLLSDLELKPNLSSMPKKNAGIGVAYSYYFGYLQIVLPVIAKCLRTALERFSVHWSRVVKKMLIIIPEDVNCPPKIADGIDLKYTKYMIKATADRSGREKRDYTVPVFELTRPGVSESVFFAGDVPACLLALREAYDSSMVNMSKDELYRARNEFVLCVKAFLTHPDMYRSYENQWEILVWPKEKENSKSLPEFLRDQIVKKKLLAEQPAIASGPIQESRDTFTIEIGAEHQPVYINLAKYALKKSGDRGHCVIINNYKFDNMPQAARIGAAKENENLKKLFTDLRFVVDVKENLTAEQMFQVLTKYQLDSTLLKSDGFVCCILSHGSLGFVLGADGKEVAVMELMKLLFDENCPVLKGKPKMFFIGACQSELGVSSDIIAASGTEPEPTDADETELKREAKPDFTSPSVTVPQYIPAEVDFIVSYATMPYRVAYRDPNSGGVYVDALCKFLKTDVEIDLALREVNQEVKTRLKKYSTKDRRRYEQETFHCITGPYKLLFLGGGL